MSTATTRTYIALGSNLGDPINQVTRAFDALAALAGSELKAVSKLYQSKALTLDNQDTHKGTVCCAPTDNSSDISDKNTPTQPDYINAVAMLDTTLPPEALLDALQAIEQAHGRVRKPEERWAARTLDLDILLYGNQIISTPRLSIPHPEMTQRDFVLQPLADIAPDLTLPTGESLEEFLKNRDILYS